MRFPSIVTFVACVSFGLTAGVAGAAVVTIDGAPVSNVIVRDGHIMVPFRAPMQQLGATVVWKDSDRSGVASSKGQELIRTRIAQKTAIIKGHPKELTIAPVLVEPQHLEYVPVEILPEISHAKLVISHDGSTATITGFDLAGVNAVAAAVAVAAAAASPAATAAATPEPVATPEAAATPEVVVTPTPAPDVTTATLDPQGKVLLVWLWLLPISAGLCLAAYLYANSQVLGSWERARRRRQSGDPRS